MITAERLEELIKQGATIWYANGFGHLEELKLDKVYLETEHELNRLYETKKHFDWARKMTAERTERFEPPMWEDIEKDKNYKFEFMNNVDIIEFMVSKAPTMFYSSGYVFAYNAGTREVYISEPATKENYIKACEIVRDLFNKGGAK